NLLLAARVAGLEGHPQFSADAGIHVDLDAAAPMRSPLFDAITLRQCTRAAYDGTPLTSEQAGALETTGKAPGVDVLLITGAPRLREVADYVAAGNIAQFAARAWAEELRSWVRFDAREALRSGDGLYGPV